MEKLENRRHMELVLLADMITRRQVTKQYCVTYLICGEVFTDLDRAAAWRALAKITWADCEIAGAMKKNRRTAKK